MPSRQPGGAPLAEVRLGAGGAPEFMAFQGRATSALGRGLPRTAADAGTMLDGMALCIGLAREAEVNMARQHAKYREYVEPFDGGGVHEYNDEYALPHGRWKHGGPWQKQPHAHSAMATVTVRSPACTGRVDVKVGSVFTVICPDCAKWRQTLNRNSNRAKEKKRKMADDPVFRAKSEAAPTDPSSHMCDCDRTVEQRLEKQSKIAEQRYEKVLQVKDAQIADLKKLLAQEKTDAIVVRDAKHCESDGSLSAEDMATLWKMPELQKMVREEFMENMHPISAALWKDQNKFKKLDDKRGMRCDRSVRCL